MEPQKLSDRELQEKQVELLEKQERHQHYFSTVITVYIIIQFVAVCAWLLLK